MADAVVADSSQDREIRMRFMRIDSRTGELLREFWKVVEPALPPVLDGFYQHVTAEPQLARLVGNDISRLKAAQGSHWSRLFNGRFDHEYMQGVRAIGLIHNKIGLEPRWYIGGYNFVLSQTSVGGAHGGELRRAARHGHRNLCLSGSDAGGAAEAAGQNFRRDP